MQRTHTYTWLYTHIYFTDERLEITSNKHLKHVNPLSADTGRGRGQVNTNSHTVMCSVIGPLTTLLIVFWRRKRWRWGSRWETSKKWQGFHHICSWGGGVELHVTAVQGQMRVIWVDKHLLLWTRAAVMPSWITLTHTHTHTRTISWFMGFSVESCCVAMNQMLSFFKLSSSRCYRHKEIGGQFCLWP